MDACGSLSAMSGNTSGPTSTYQPLIFEIIMHSRSLVKYIILFGTFLIGSFSGVFSKYASFYQFLSLKYLLFLSASILILFVYAILWQQIIKRMPVSDAYMLRGMTCFIGLTLAYLIFNEPITTFNCIGTTITIAGIILYAKS